MAILFSISLILYLILWWFVKTTVVYERKPHSLWSSHEIDESSGKPLKVKVWVYVACIASLLIPAINFLAATSMSIIYWCTFSDSYKSKVWKHKGKIYKWLNKEV